jgi:hypothetical protein
MTQLYSLSKVASYLADYHVDASGQVYSTKQGNARALKASAPSTSQYKYWSFSHHGSTRTMRTDELARMLDRDSGFQAWKRNMGSASMTASASTGSGKGYIVGSITDSGVSFSSRPKVHSSESEARVECERLASMYKGKTFMYVEIKGSVKATGFSWS